MKAQTVQLALFASAAPMTPRFMEAVTVKPSFRKDKEGNVTEEVSTETIKLLPRKSKDKPDIADACGLSGQALMAFESEVRRELLGASQSEFTNRIASGNYTFNTFRRNLRTGVLTFSIKPEYKKAATAMSDAELLAEIAARGLAAVTPAAEAAPVEVEATVSKENATPAKGKAPAKK